MIKRKSNSGLDALVGKFFHTTKQCEHGSDVAQLQGRVLAALSDSQLLVETFEWLMGEPYGQRVISFDSLVEQNPLFYDNSESMRFSYEYGALSHSGGCPK